MPSWSRLRTTWSIAAGRRLSPRLPLSIVAVPALLLPRPPSDMSFKSGFSCRVLVSRSCVDNPVRMETSFVRSMWRCALRPSLSRRKRDPGQLLYMPLAMTTGFDATQRNFGHFITDIRLWRSGTIWVLFHIWLVGWLLKMVHGKATKNQIAETSC